MDLLLSHWQSAGALPQVSIAAGASLVGIVVLNAIRQTLFNNPKESPVVFRWIPISGSCLLRRLSLQVLSPIHSLLRVVKNPMPVEGTDMVVPPNHLLLSSPGASSRHPMNF